MVSEEKASFFARFLIYQKERFPFLGYGVIISVFSFSAVSYSLLCRGKSEFVSWDLFLGLIFTTFTLFLLLRIFDEHKDAKDDLAFRNELPVPRGLISLKELRLVGWIFFSIALVINIFLLTPLLPMFAAIMTYLLLMWKEFFVSEWLKKHLFIYAISHMFIIPVVDVYASGLDWRMEGSAAPFGLLFFFCVSYLNGVILEVGRKIRHPEHERVGVQTYSAILGPKKVIYLWIIMLIASLITEMTAFRYAGQEAWYDIVLIVVFALVAIPAVLFFLKPTVKLSKTIEFASQMWTLFSYLLLGALPMLIQLLNK